jgi:HK97 family phage prohead protease
METKQLNLEVKATDEGIIEGYGSVFDVLDSYGDRIEVGAFAETIRKRKPKMLWQHDMGDPIGAWDEVAEDAKGLLMRGRIAVKSTRGRDAVELVKAGAIDGLSIGFRVSDYEMEGNNRVIKSIDLYEVSLVTMPANALATITDIRGMEDAPAVERAIRAALGLSRNEAKAFMARGMKGLLDLRDAGEAILDANQREVEAVKSQLEQLFRSLAK